MKIQSINQNNYPNRNVAFKQNVHGVMKFACPRACSGPERTIFIKCEHVCQEAERRGIDDFATLIKDSLGITEPNIISKRNGDTLELWHRDGTDSNPKEIESDTICTNCDAITARMKSTTEALRRLNDEQEA